MTDIELVIKIPKKIYNKILYQKAFRCDVSDIKNIIRNGTLLRKGHGRIVDIGPYEGKVIASRKYYGVNRLIEIAELDTIIEADKESTGHGNDDRRTPKPT